MSDILEQQQAYYRARSAEYDQWWERQGRYDQGTERNQQWQIEGQIVRDTLHQLPAQNHILELACGTGIWTKELVKLGQSITAVDASAEMLAINQAKVQSDHVTYIQADLFTWQSEQQFDMIFFGFWLSHVPSNKLQAFLQGVSQMLKPNGYLFMIDSQRNQTATAKNQNMLDESPIHTRILNDGREFQIIKVFYDRDGLQSELAQVNIDADVRLTNEFFIYAHGQKVIRS